MPPIAELERLHAIRPDLVDRVADEAFLEAKHRREMEKSHFELMKKEASSNRWFASFIVIACLAVTTYLGWLGKELSADLIQTYRRTIRELIRVILINII